MSATVGRGFGAIARGGMVLATTAAALMAALLLGSPSQAAGTFDPGLIISDEAFYNNTAMTVGDIDAFISGKGANCIPGKDGSPCLKSFRQDRKSVV